jgi:hypothetical protein
VALGTDAVNPPRCKSLKRELRHCPEGAKHARLHLGCANVYKKHSDSHGLAIPMYVHLALWTHACRRDPCALSFVEQWQDGMRGGLGVSDLRKGHFGNHDVVDSDKLVARRYTADKHPIVLVHQLRYRVHNVRGSFLVRVLLVSSRREEKQLQHTKEGQERLQKFSGQTHTRRPEQQVGVLSSPQAAGYCSRGPANAPLRPPPSCGSATG